MYVAGDGQHHLSSGPCMSHLNGVSITPSVHQGTKEQGGRNKAGNITHLLVQLVLQAFDIPHQGGDEAAAMIERTSMGSMGNQVHVG